MNASGRNIKIAFSIKLLCLMMIMHIVSPLLKAQSFYGSIVGTVADATGAVVPDALVTVTNAGTNEAQTAPTDSAGKYNFVNLVPAAYKVQVEKVGFKRFLREQLNVQVGEVLRVDTQLQVGTATETVEVSTGAPLLPSDSSSLTAQISGAQVQQLPLNGRNVENLIALAPGVVPGGASQGDTGLNQGTRTAGGAGWGNYQIGGAIQGQSAQYIDGVPNNVLNGNTIALVPTQDAIQEFSVVTSNATADFGRFAGGVVNMTTKSGSNSFHGSAYEYFRNNDLQCQRFLQQPQRQSPGTVQSKPVWRCSQRTHQAGQSVLPVYLGGILGSHRQPCAHECADQRSFQSEMGRLRHAGRHFPQRHYRSVGKLQHQYDRQPRVLDHHQSLRQGNCGDPPNKILKTFYPDPNQNPTTATSNWFLTTPLANNQNQYNGRIDYNLSNKQRIFGRYTYWNLHDTGHTEFLDKGLGGVSWPTADGHNANFTQQFVLGDSYTFNPTTVLDVRVNYVRETDPNYPDSTTVNEAQFGAAYATLAPQMKIHVLPAFNASGGLHNLYNMGNFPNYSIAWWNTYGINANLVKILGAHSLKFGAELRLMDQSGIQNLAGGSGTYSYTTGFTGDEWASFLMGYSTAEHVQYGFHLSRLHVLPVLLRDRYLASDTEPDAEPGPALGAAGSDCGEK